MSTETFSRHLKTHSKPYHCKSCPSGFALASDLARHAKSLHRVGNVQYRCHIEICQFTSNRKDNLKKHNKKYHAGAPLAANSDIAMAENTTTGPLNELVSCETASDNSNSLYIVSILMQAATSGDVTTLGSLLDAGVPLETRADDESTALHCAARAGQSKAAQYLLDRGAEMSANNAKGRLPVHEALLSRDLDTVRIFLRRTAKPELPGARQMFWDYLGRSNSYEVLELYMELLGEDFKAKDRAIIFHRAVCAGSETLVAALKGHPDIDLNQSLQDFKPIHYAARFGRESVVELLLDSEGVDEHIFTTISRMHTLHIAASYGQYKVLQLLLQHGDSDISCRDGYDMTPLQYAALNGHWRAVHILLEHAVCLNDRTSTPDLILHSTSVRTDLVRRLLDHADFGDPNVHQSRGNRRNLLHMLSNKGDCEVIEVLLAHKKVDVNAKDYFGYSPLILAAKNGRFEAVGLLLQHPDIDVNYKKSWGNGTALEYARLFGHQEIVELLLSHGAIDDRISEPSAATPTDNTSAAHDSNDTQSIALPLEYETDLNFDLDGVMYGIPDWKDFPEEEEEMFE
ncbi:metal ion binding [Stemphylium lycopersici]|uniref:Metal ion binding n=1 Tax=Stemphylium lycopersici TaxID=183478 RepID=A0A364N254_STELY|nr:metal ion binding [Stemphylium lycopersici]